MATVRDILSAKGSQVVEIGPHATAFDAALLMNEHKIGGLVVCDEKGIRGIVTERDILRRVVSCRRDPSATLVLDIMTPDVMCCQPHTTLEEARVVMRERRFRHIPVLDAGGKLCGIISISDLNAHDVQSKEMTIHLLHQYIQGHAGTPAEPTLV